MTLTKHIPERTIKVAVLICAYAFLIYQLSTFKHWNELPSLVTSFSFRQITSLMFVILLMPLNWLLETVKWRFLLIPIQKISFKQAIHSVYIGLAAGLASPGKIGEWPGRTLIFAKEHRRSIGAIGVLNSLIKTLSISFIGILSWLTYTLLIDNKSSFLIEVRFLIPAISSVFILIVMFLFSRSFVSRLIRIIGTKQTSISGSDLTWISIPYRAKAFGLSLSRVLIFSLQFILLARFFLGNQFSGTMFLLPPIYFFIITFIPAFALSDPGIRGSVALLLFGSIGLETPVMAIVGIVLWIINTIMPFFLGHLTFGVFSKND